MPKLKNTEVKKSLNKKPIEKKVKQSKEFIRSNGVVVTKATSKSSWKSFERKVAEDFNTKRVPLSGSNSGHGTQSDSLHERVYIECKVRQKFSLQTLFEDTERKAKVEHKTPVVAVKQKGSNGYLLVCRPDDLKKLAAEYMASQK